jgi:tetratricopeptide (TPR) repeat protein
MTRLLFILLLLLGCGFPAMSVTKPDGTDTSKLNDMARLARKYLDGYKTAKADSVITEAFALAEEDGMNPTAQMYWSKARLLMSFKESKEIMPTVQKAIDLARTQLGPMDQCRLNSFYSEALTYMGQFQQSIDVLGKNIEFAREHKLMMMIPGMYGRMATVYEWANDSLQAEKALETMLASATEENDLVSAESATSRLGRIRLTNRRNFGEADYYYKRSLDLAKKMADSTRISYALTNIAWNFYLDKKLDSSLFYYKLSLEYSLPARNFSIADNSYGNMGTIFRDLKQHENAREAWQKGIYYALMVKDWYTVSWIYQDMSLMYAQTGDFRKAYDYQVLYKAYNDTLESQKFNEGLAQARARFEADTKEKGLQLLSLKLKNQQLLIYGFASLIVLTLVIGLLLLRQSRANARRKITEMNHKILELTQANLRQQMNPHFIFNTLNSIQYYMYKHDKLATNNYLTKFSNLMRKILENSRNTAVPIRDELDALQLYLELESIRFRDKFDYRIILDEEVDPLMYKIPTMMIQPYVENAICHGLMLKPEKGLVTITIRMDTDHLLCLIEDNGIGRQASLDINRNKKINHQSLGTHITESRLDLVNSLYGSGLQTTYTDLKDVEGKACGTCVEIHIPILT